MGSVTWASEPDTDTEELGEAGADRAFPPSPPTSLHVASHCPCVGQAG